MFKRKPSQWFVLTVHKKNFLRTINQTAGYEPSER